MHGDGSQSFEAVARLADANTNTWAGVPIDLGPKTDLVFVQFYGTGLKNRGAPVTAKVGGVDATVQFAGAHPTFTGLDQINVLLPRSLAGRGTRDVVLTAGDKTANTVPITVQ